MIVRHTSRSPYGYIRLVFAFVLATALVSCSKDDPSPLTGTWRMNVGLVAMPVQFRSGGTEMLGAIEKVSYTREGNDVIVNYASGVMKGSAVRYTVTGSNTAHSAFGNLQRVT